MNNIEIDKLLVLATETAKFSGNIIMSFYKKKNIN